MPSQRPILRRFALLALIVVGVLAATFAVTSQARAQGGGPTRLFVNDDAAPGGNGLSWATAFNSLSDAIGFAQANSIPEIWVAAGTYRTIGGAPFRVSGGSLSLYGGFAGNETQLSQRSIEFNPTILSGDFLGDSQPSGAGIIDDANQVVLIGPGTTGAYRVDGFIVEYARVAGIAFSFMAAGTQPRVTNCTIRYIFAKPSGDAAGILQEGGSAQCTYDRNTVHSIFGGNGTNGSQGNNGNNGTNGGTDGSSGNGLPGGSGFNGSAGSPGSVGGRGAGIVIDSGAHARLVANRIADIRGGNGGAGGPGGRGGDGGNGGNPATPGNHNGGAGGPGGRGGDGGNGGRGGDAIGILYNHPGAGAPTLAMNSVSGLRPGNGASGGAGGTGGRGGNGAAGNTDPSGQFGGDGGNAGNGGSGGNAGNGGAAGDARHVSCSITTAARTVSTSTFINIFTGSFGSAGNAGAGGAPGTPGAGGAGTSEPGAGGGAGSAGAQGNTGTNGTASVVSSVFSSGSGSVNVRNCIIDTGAGTDDTAFNATGSTTMNADFCVVVNAENLTSPNASTGASIRTGPIAFYDPAGADLIPGTIDDDLSLTSASTAIDSGRNADVPPDALDEDTDGNTAEASPFDLDRRARFTDVPGVTDTGTGTPPIVDIGAVEADVGFPQVLAFNRITPDPATVQVISYLLIFDRPVTGLIPGSFTPQTTGNVGVLSIDVLGTGASFLIDVTLSGSSGTITLNLQDNDSILSQFSVPLNGPGTGTIPGPTTNVSISVPQVASLMVQGGLSALSNTSRTWRATFTESVLGVGTDDFSLAPFFVNGASITQVSGSGTTWDITVYTGTLGPVPVGTLTLVLTDNDSIVSASTGLPLGGAGAGNGSVTGQTLLVSADCNTNGVPDTSEIADGFSQDCNGNNVPDECDVGSSMPDGSFGPTPYLSAANSPFDLSRPGVTSYLENFEDGLLNAPGVSVNGGSIGFPGINNDSVDADDGVIDGFGRDGYSYNICPGTLGIRFTFNNTAFGRLPQFAGMVFTDASPGVPVVFEAFGESGQPIGSFAPAFDSGAFSGETGEDRFFGIVHAAGISAIRMSHSGGNCLEIDHLQYGVFSTTGGAQDCNNNGIPDSCDLSDGTPDCNFNGVPDSCDIASGASQDANSDGIPDECQPPPGGDCNDNGVADAQDIASGFSRDCNLNGVPDECEAGSPFTLYTDTTWRARGTAPPAGWNTTVGFDDSDSAGWFVPAVQSSGPPDTLWSFPGAAGGSNETYLRKVFVLDSAPASAMLTIGMDDDATVFINGVQANVDENCLSGAQGPINVTPLLHAGANLIAVFARDCFCCGRGVAVTLELSGGGDCNANGVPDSCDFEQGAAGDCNDNGVPDACEVAKSQVYFNDFSGPVGGEWSASFAEFTPSGERFLGQFGNTGVTLFLNGLTPHRALAVDFDLYIIRSWDGDTAGVGPDLFGVSLDGRARRVWTFTSAALSASQSYPGTYGQAQFPPGTGAAQVNRLGFDGPFGDSVYRVRLLLPHTSSSAAIQFRAQRLQQIEDESWGLDNVSVSVVTASDADCDADGGIDSCAEPLADGLLGPSAYLTFAQSPFASIGAPLVYLENFESGAIGVPGVTTGGGVVFGPNGFIDSVDEDDGFIDGNGNLGRSFYSAAGDITFTFDGSAPPGGLPQFAGIVFTDLSFGPRLVGFEARDAEGNLVGSTSATLGPVGANGDTSEDRFFGIVHKEGIRSIRIFAPGTDLEVDHLQFGRFSYQDCNLNHQPDLCDINSGQAPDVNGNGVPDPCEGAIGFRQFPFDIAGLFSLDGCVPPDQRIRASDLNGDGREDLVTGPTGTRITIHVQNSGGKGATASFLNAPESLSACVAGDFNLDGLPDIVASASESDRLIIFRNSPQEPLDFTLEGTTPTSPNRAVAMCIGDFNTDGRPDIAGVTPGGQVVVYTNTSAPAGAISFTRAVVSGSLPFGADFADIASGDFDNDGRPDIAAVGDNAVVLRNNGNGTFSVLSIPISSVATCVVSADLNHDGFADLVFGTRSSGGGSAGELGVYFGPGITLNQIESGLDPRSLVVGDINRDGNADVLARSADGSLDWFKGDAGGFLERLMIDGPNPDRTGACLADIDADADPDLVCTFSQLNGRTCGGVGVYLSRLPHTDTDLSRITAIALQADAPSSMTVADINRDGKPDLVCGSFFDDAVWWCRHDEHVQGNWARVNVASMAQSQRADGVSAVAAGDFNLDGRTDIAVGGILNGRVYVYLNNNNGQSFTQVLVDASASGVASLTASDLDGDGRPELIAGLATPGLVRAYFAQPSASAPFITFQGVNLVSGVGGVRSVSAGDFTFDGCPDLMVAAYNANSVNFYTGRFTSSSSPTGTPALTFGDIPSPTCVVLSDVEANGYRYAVVTSFGSSSLRLIALVSRSGGGDQRGYDYSFELPGASWVTTGDVNGDGTVDIVAVGRQAHSPLLVLNNPYGCFCAFQAQGTFVPLESGSTCAIGDFDADGRGDFAAASFNGDNYVVVRGFHAAFDSYPIGSGPQTVPAGGTAPLGVVGVNAYMHFGDTGVRYHDARLYFWDRGFGSQGTNPRPLTVAEVNSLFSKFEVYRDTTNDLVFDANDDRVGLLNGPFAFSDGFSLRVPLSDAGTIVDPPQGDSVRVAYFHVVGTLKSGAATANPNTFALGVFLDEESFSDSLYGEPLAPRYPGLYIAGGTVTASPPLRDPCPSDLNSDGRTNTSDLTTLLLRFGQPVAPGTPGDINLDGVVNTSDLTIVLLNFGRNCQ